MALFASCFRRRRKQVRAFSAVITLLCLMLGGLSVLIPSSTRTPLPYHQQRQQATQRASSIRAGASDGEERLPFVGGSLFPRPLKLLRWNESVWEAYGDKYPVKPAYIDRECSCLNSSSPPACTFQRSTMLAAAMVNV